MARHLPPLPGGCPASTSAIDEPRIRGFIEDGFSFIPIRRAHLDFIAWVMNREAPDFAAIFGAAMVDRQFIPVGFLLAYFEPDGTTSIHAHFGRWLKTYPKDVLRHMQGFIATLLGMGVRHVYAIADRGFEGSDTLIHWFGGVPTGAMHEFGPVYEIDLSATKLAPKGAVS